MKSQTGFEYFPLAHTLYTFFFSMLFHLIKKKIDFDRLKVSKHLFLSVERFKTGNIAKHIKRLIYFTFHYISFSSPPQEARIEELEEKRHLKIKKSNCGNLKIS